jgi:glutamine amidotransferase
MCDLLGMSFSSDVRAGISLNMFQMRGKENPDGWGLAFYREGHLQIVKEAMSATKSPLYDFIEQYPQSDTFISHVRRSTRGEPSYLNTHPFYRFLKIDGNDKEFCFAHNGTLTEMDGLNLEWLSPLGATDSEHLFCFILERIKGRGITEWREPDFRFLEDTLRSINNSANTMNCLFSDGEHLFCYSDIQAHNGGLRYAPQKHPYGLLDFVEEDLVLGSLDIQGANISDMEPTRSSGFVIVTRDLTNPVWKTIDSGHLRVFRKGVEVYSS